MIIPYVEYEKFRGDLGFPRIWNDLLAEKMNLNLVNYGEGGSGNDYIFQMFCKHLYEIDNQDIVIVQWTFNTRFKWTIHKPNGTKRWVHNMTPLYEEQQEFLSTNLDYVLFNERFTEVIHIERDNPIYMEDVIHYERVINEMANHRKFKVFFWDGDYSANAKVLFNNSNYIKRRIGFKYVNKGDDLFQEVFKRGGQNIKMETNELINDGHMGEKGHQKLFEIIYEEISNIDYEYQEKFKTLI
jgi:hypothetical protein